MPFISTSEAKNEPPKPSPAVKILWSFPKAGISSAENTNNAKMKDKFIFEFSPTLDETGEHIFIASKQAIFKLNSREGTEIKRKTLEQPIAAPIIFNKSKLYILDKGNNLICLESNLNENPIWNVKIGTVGCISMQLTLSGLLCTFFDGTITLHNLEEGNVIWQCNVGEEISHPPAIDTQKSIFYIIGSKGNLFKIRLKNGTFERSAAFEQKPLSSPIFHDDSLYMSFENGRFTSFNPEKVKKNWELSLINNIVAPAVAKEDIVCFNSLSNQVFCCDNDSGTLEARFTGKQRFYLPPLIHDNLIFAFGYYDGILAANIERGKPIGWLQHLGKPVTPAIDLNEKNIFLIVLDNNRLEALDYSEVVKSQLIDE